MSTKLFRSLTLALALVLILSLTAFSTLAAAMPPGDEAEINAEMNGWSAPAPRSLPVPDQAAHARALQLLGSTGILLAPDSTNKRVMAFDPLNGDLVDADFIPADTAHLSTPKHAMLSADGQSILVADQITDGVYQYDFDGNYIGLFAPAGGVNTAILDNIRGMALRPNGNLLVTVGSSGNANAIAEFDTSGNYLGNFIAAGSGGLSSPFAILHRTSDVLVDASTSDNVHRYDTSGAYLDNLITAIAFAQQMVEAANSNILIANFSTPNSGVQEYTAAGAAVATYTIVTGNRGAYELGNGNILTSNASGVHEISRANVLVATEISGVSSQYIEYVVSPSASISLDKTVGLDPNACALTNEVTVAAGTTVVYCYTVTNTGSETLGTHTLVDDHLGTLLNNFAYSLTPGASAFITESATINATTVNSATWTASNAGVGGVEASDTATVTVQGPTALTLVNAQAAPLPTPWSAFLALALATLLAAALTWRLRAATQR